MSCVEDTMSDSVSGEEKKRKHEGTANGTKKPYRQDFITLDLEVLAKKAMETWPAKEPGTKESGNKNPHTEQIDDQELDEEDWAELERILKEL
jgi:hypothetical protein